MQQVNNFLVIEIMKRTIYGRDSTAQLIYMCEVFHVEYNAARD